MYTHTNPAPKLSDVTVEELMHDPYPAFERMRELASAVWVDAANIHLVTRFDDILHVEHNHALFASTNPGSLMNKVMGHSLMRKDDEAHKAERDAVEPAFKPGIVKEHWNPIFNRIASELIDDIANASKTELFETFAAPMASKALMEMLGLKELEWQTLAEWSQALMDGVGNYHADAEISRRANAASDGVDNAIDSVIGYHTDNHNPTILSSMAHAEQPHSIEQIRANIKVIIGGGLNEPRDAILTCVYALLTHPEQRAQVMQDTALYKNLFEEAIRWVSPIGMYPRRVTQNTLLGDTLLNEGDQIGLCVGAANRDPRKFENPSLFDLNRKKLRHVAFGSGPHFCAGTWVARQMVGHIAVPMLFERLSNLQLDPAKNVEMKGWVFRGPTVLPVQWSS